MSEATIESAWVEDRIKFLNVIPVSQLMQRARNAGVDYGDTTRISTLVGRVARAEWLKEHNEEAQWGNYPRADVAGVPFDANDGFTDMESGPQAFKSIAEEILERWIAATGGRAYYDNNDGEGGRVFRSYGRGLVAVLDAMGQEGKLPPSDLNIEYHDLDWKSADDMRSYLKERIAAAEEKWKPTVGAVFGEGSGYSGFFFEPGEIRSEGARAIVSTILPKVVTHFLKKNADYGDNHREGLGPAAEFVGIHRKVKKLEKALWEGHDLTGEGVEELLADLIGACLITLDLVEIGRLTEPQ